MAWCKNRSITWRRIMPIIMSTIEVGFEKPEAFISLGEFIIENLTSQGAEEPSGFSFSPFAIRRGEGGILLQFLPSKRVNVMRLLQTGFGRAY
ncbi:hypothetical protein CDAR_597411 [Caerostris darwini]|uniref:Uncharacterized protein n=1 Tax=Caerostris darwini TaxID=1538125 RepID=A0AAV4TWU4_9ARAC|nr:hypothetical protein CDAR_597411 [Caerostris darwini]